MTITPPGPGTILLPGRSPRDPRPAPCETCGYGPQMHDPETGDCPIRYVIELTPHGHYVVDLHTNERISGPLPFTRAESRWCELEGRTQ